ncbi:TIGR00266 family protein [Nocardia terpenica]|uniref:TIGR00266 family protein n=1 Tax=Nocardia terpenica TaxID=455432 RepID=UPI00189530D7|nr:TIGR00266 family protein [Nocardia terpenica]MBF6060995.1 TIGR00266 family protein [Nocardia terpenica]MBF6108793.1 TIGR00266 family protein [Nocardia terpenica]MBF6114021.1 TIGR00266 family protein [Nocardia terpenica]MBF6120355.1 TIGR00266 family protein [Nocardia terpenica]MBF6156334.1 TIGR00266 family protein [Nocardia terpenica]
MKVELRHNPSSTIGRCFLAGGEPMRVESGAMVAHSAGVALAAKAEGGILAGLKRSVLAGESFFVSTFTAPPQGGWVDVAPALPGDMLALPIVAERPFFISRGSWIANSHGVQVETKWGGFANLFGGEGGFGLRAHGRGEVVLGVFGAIDVFDLQPGEPVAIDSGHVVAYDLSIKFGIRRAVSGRSLQSLKSGEGLVFDFTGPGRVLLQTRNPGAFAAWAGAVTASG